MKPEFQQIPSVYLESAEVPAKSIVRLHHDIHPYKYQSLGPQEDLYLMGLYSAGVSSWPYHGPLLCAFVHKVCR